MNKLVKAPMVKASVVKPPAVSVVNTTFTGIHWDSKSVQTVQTVAEGLVENAKALGQLASLFRSQNIQIECLLKIEPPKTVTIME